MKRTHSEKDDDRHPPLKTELVPTVINVRVQELRKYHGCDSLAEWRAQDEVRHLYVGRKNFRVEGTFTSKWHNPFKVLEGDPRVDTIDKVAERFRKHVLSSPKLLASLPELSGKVLGCWCHPNPCHAHILRDLWLEHVAVTQEQQSEEKTSNTIGNNNTGEIKK